MLSDAGIVVDIVHLTARDCFRGHMHMAQAPCKHPAACLYIHVPIGLVDVLHERRIPGCWCQLSDRDDAAAKSNTEGRIGWQKEQSQTRHPLAESHHPKGTPLRQGKYEGN